MALFSARIGELEGDSLAEAAEGTDRVGAGDDSGALWGRTFLVLDPPFDRDEDRFGSTRPESLTSQRQEACSVEAGGGSGLACLLVSLAEWQVRG